MKRPSPLIQMTVALVGLCGTLVLLADLFFGLMPDRNAQTMQLRRQVSEALAVQVATLLQEQDQKALQRTLDGVVARTEGMRSLAIRRADGSLMMQAGEHARHWRATGDDASNPEQLTVPLKANGERWGSFEVAFLHRSVHPVWQFLTQPIMVLLLFISGAGTLVFGLYMRRTLQHLDPAAVIPERVQGAFDAMAEGVVVLDARARVLLANQSFRAIPLNGAAVSTGTPLSALPWLAQALPTDAAAHPWQQAMAQRAASSGHTLEAAAGSADARHFVVNCAPILDAGGHVRGCVVTFDDVSELHQANEALHATMAELKASQTTLQAKNLELERLATRDPMTGCLNRRAFYAAFEPLLARTRVEGGALACLMVDIDHFKSVNDTHGHPVGDVVIQGLAKLLLASARSGDLVCRYGGEEFCVVLPGTDPADAAAFAERLRARVERECGTGVREVPNLRVTASLGLCSLTPDVATPVALIDRADQALYAAKRGGRNRVERFDVAGVVSGGVHSSARGGAAEIGVDALTGCALPAAFQALFESALQRARARREPVSAVKFALDPQRALLIQRDPGAFDETLRALVAVIRDFARPGDVLVRLDAEHIGVLAPACPINDALLFAERVRAHVAQAFAPVPLGDTGEGALRITASAGVDCLPADASGAPTLIERAGKALLRAKRDGANRVQRFAPGPAPSVATVAPPASNSNRAAARRSSESTEQAASAFEA